MKTEYLKEYIVLAETCSFSEAAYQLYISQSSLSKHIKAIEDELGVPLFDRTTRSVKLSEFGQAFVPYAKKVIELHEKCFSEIRSKIPTDRESLIIGSIRSLAHYHITDIIAQFKTENQNIDIKIYHSYFGSMPLNNDRLKDLLRQKKCELAFIRTFGTVDEDFESVNLIDESLVALIPADHRLAQSHSITIEELKGMELLTLEESSSIYRIIFESCRAHGFDPIFVYTDPKPENLLELVNKKMGIALLMKQLAVYLLNPDLKMVQITPIIPSEICLCYLKNAHLSDAAKLFIQCTNSQSKRL